MGFSVGVISGPREETEEAFDRRVLREMYTICRITDIKELDVEKFRNEIKHCLNNENSSIHDILVCFDNLTYEEKVELLKNCSISFNEVSAFQELCNNTLNSGKTTMLNYNLFDENKHKHFYDLPVNPKVMKEYTKQDNFNNFVNSKMKRRKH